MRQMVTGLASALMLAGTAQGAAARDGVASFDWQGYEGAEVQAPEGQYRNPVLPGLHPAITASRNDSDINTGPTRFAARRMPTVYPRATVSSSSPVTG